MLATRHYMIDAYGCFSEQTNNFLLINDFLINVTHKLGMVPVMPPYILPFYYCEDAEDVGLFRNQTVFLKRENVSRGPGGASPGPCGKPAQQAAPTLQPQGQASAQKALHLLAAAVLGMSQHPPRAQSGAGLHGCTVPGTCLRPAPDQRGAGDQGLAHWQAGR